MVPQKCGIRKGEGLMSNCRKAIKSLSSPALFRVTMVALSKDCTRIVPRNNFESDSRSRVARLEKTLSLPITCRRLTTTVLNRMNDVSHTPPRTSGLVGSPFLNRSYSSQRRGQGLHGHCRETIKSGVLSPHLSARLCKQCRKTVGTLSRGIHVRAT